MLAGRASVYRHLRRTNRDRPASFVAKNPVSDFRSEFIFVAINAKMILFYAAIVLSLVPRQEEITRVLGIAVSPHPTGSGRRPGRIPHWDQTRSHSTAPEGTTTTLPTGRV